MTERAKLALRPIILTSRAKEMHDPQPFAVRAELASVLARLVRRGLPRSPSIGNVTALEYGALDLTHRAGAGRTQHGLLRIDISGAPALEIDRLWRLETCGAIDERVGFSLRRGWVGCARALGTSGSVTIGASEPATASIDCADWTIRREQATPRIWAGRVDGLWACPRGNLRLLTPSGRAVAWNLGLHLAHRTPCATVYLVDGWNRSAPVSKRNQGPFYLVVDCDRPEPPNANDLRSWCRALSFVLGTRLAVRQMVGVNDDGAVGGRLGVWMQPARKAPFPCHPPTPINGAGPAHSVPFFEAIISKTAPAIWPLAADYFLDSFADPPTEAYVKMITALEGLASHVAVDDSVADRLCLVRDREAWARWVSAELPTVLGHFAPQHHDSVEARVANLSTVGATQRVRRVFQALGLDWPKWARDQEKLWNTPRHGGVLNPKRSHRDVAQLRVLLVAMVAQWAEYLGPIIGPDLLRYGVYGAADPSWWSTTDDTVPEYIAEVEDPEAEGGA